VIDRDRIVILAREHIALVPYDASWPERYAVIEARLMRSLPTDLFTRISHIGSTAVPGLAAKPIIDVQVEITDADRVRHQAVPVLQDLGYEFIWRPTMGETAPYYAWFIARDEKGRRTEHLHFVEPDAATRDRILFRDFLRGHPEEAGRYEALKHALTSAHPNDRAAYTQGKTDFIRAILERARTIAS
jgi:GrpB-like predicted nucleotidyltransferase (UPF0157 family)